MSISALNQSQQAALELLETRENIFLTGAAGTGKSFLLRHYLRNQTHPILASTGAAAILIGGRTFHSFFGLGIMEKGLQSTIERALANKRLVKRLKTTHTVVIDEISMISGITLQAAETIARKARGNTTPWGGIRIIAVGDFAQLPPVNPYSSEKEWAFLNSVWDQSEFKPIVLGETMRTTDADFLEVLGYIRVGIVNAKVIRFLESKVSPPNAEFDGTRLFSRKDDVERFNLQQLQKMRGNEQTFTTIYRGKEAEVEKFKRNAPIPEVLLLKEGALIMLRQNDPAGHWVNGSLGHIRKMKELELTIELMEGRIVKVARTDFTLLDAEGHPVVTASNFPVTLAWAITIHKAQGTTLQKCRMDLRRLWEPGQAYVALSRMQSSDGLFLEGWGPESIITDPTVTEFYRSFQYDS